MSKRLKIAATSVCGVLIVIIIIIAVSMRKTATHEKYIYKGISINNIDVGGMTSEEAQKCLLENFTNKLRNKVFTLVYDNKEFKLDYRILNAHYEIEEAVKKALVFGKEGNIIVRTKNRLNLIKNKKNIELNFTFSSSMLEAEVKKISKVVNYEPVNAQISFDGKVFSVRKDVQGKKLDEQKLCNSIKPLIQPSGDDRRIDMPVNDVEAIITSERLSKIDTKLSSFTTAFKLSNPDRVENIRIAASSINGTVILPGEVFSMNKTLGPRIASKGYREAPIIVKGELVPGMAGGICQVSSTLYNAVLLSNFEIVERKAHGLKVSYVDPGRDATLTGSSIDLKFKNINSAPIFIYSVLDGSTITVSIYGANEHPNQTVEIITEIYERIPPQTEYVEDPELEKGTRVIDRKPAEGIKSKTYRKIYLNGKLIKTQLLSKDYYKPVNKKIRVGTKSSA